jgi:GT2 family glycosyltransferase
VATAVLIVNFRGYGDLDRCLGSLAPYLRPDDEVIVVDNESDRSQLMQVAARHPRIISIPRDVNAGFAAGVNDAVRHSSAPFLCLLNPDTIVEGPILSVMEDWLETHPQSWVVGPRVLNADGSTQASARSFPGLSTALGGRSTWLTRRYPGNPWSRRNLLGLQVNSALDVDWVSGSCLMTRRTTFDRLAGFDQSFFLYWEDADYCRRATVAGGRCTYLPSVPVRHIGSGSARFDPPRAIRTFHASAFRLYWKHGGITARLAAPLVRAALYLRGELHLRRSLRAFRRVSAAASPLPNVSVEPVVVAAHSHAERARPA